MSLKDDPSGLAGLLRAIDKNTTRTTILVCLFIAATGPVFGDALVIKLVGFIAVCVLTVLAGTWIFGRRPQADAEQEEERP